MNCNIRFLQVSRLCCVLCWSLLSKLSIHPEQHFGARGCHAKVFPAQLPPWLPENVVQDMLILVRQMIQDEVHDLMDNDTKGKGPSRRASISSVQSTGSLTASSVVINSSLTSEEHTVGSARRVWRLLEKTGVARLLGLGIKSSAGRGEKSKTRLFF